jgi:hypothetical protein
VQQQYINTGWSTSIELTRHLRSHSVCRQEPCVSHTNACSANILLVVPQGSCELNTGYCSSVPATAALPTACCCRAGCRLVAPSPSRPAAAAAAALPPGDAASCACTSGTSSRLVRAAVAAERTAGKLERVTGTRNFPTWPVTNSGRGGGGRMLVISRLGSSRYRMLVM